MADTTRLGGWAPAPGSVARKDWPLVARWARWLVHRPALLAVLALGALVAIEAGPVALAALTAVTAMALMVWWRARSRSTGGRAGCCWACGGNSGRMGSGGARR